MIFSEKIQVLRKQNGLSQEKLAEKLDVSRQAVSKWESGQSVPEIDKIVAISDMFNVSTDYLIKNIIIEPAIIENKANIDNKQSDKKFITGLVLFGLGFISIILFWLVFIVSNRNYFAERNGLDYQGFPAFLKIYGGLEMLFYICWIFIIYGLFLLFQKQVVSIVQMHKKLHLTKIGFIIMIIAIIFNISLYFIPLKINKHFGNNYILSHLENFSYFRVGSLLISKNTFYFLCALYLISIFLILLSHYKQLLKNKKSAKLS